MSATGRLTNAQRYDGFSQAEVGSFWQKWNYLAKQREALIRAGNIDWTEVARLLTESNKLMYDAPDRRLRRIARLARLAPDLDLTCNDCIIYCICGPHVPYIGQCGAITGARPPIQRFSEHVQKGRSLNKKYVGRKCKAMCASIRLGPHPSLPCLIAKHGISPMTMYPIERVPACVAGERERYWNRVHAPTANQRTPFGGVDRLVWQLIADEQADSPELKTLKAKPSCILSKGVSHLRLPTVIRFLFDPFGHLQTPLFEKLFRDVTSAAKTAWGIELPRRITVRLPSYSDATLRNGANFVRKGVAFFTILDALKALLQKCVTVISQPPLTVGDVLKRGAQLRVPSIVAEELERKNAEHPFADWIHFSDRFGMWVVGSGHADPLQQVQRTTMQRVHGLPCHCPTLLSLSPSLENATRHVILRSPLQWQALFGPTTGRMLGSNPRNRVFPSPEFVVDSLSTVAEHLLDSAIPVFSVSDGGFQDRPLMPLERVCVLVCDLFCTLWSEVTTASDTYPWLSAPLAHAAPHRLRAFGLRGGAWDTALFRPAGFFSKLSELHWTSSIIFGSRFSIWGWSTSPDVAMAMVTREILTRARESGVIGDAIRAQRLRKLSRTDESVHAWLDDFLSSRHPPDADCVTPSDPYNAEANPPPLSSEYCPKRPVCLS